MMDWQDYSGSNYMMSALDTLVGRLWPYAWIDEIQMVIQKSVGFSIRIESKSNKAAVAALLAVLATYREVSN